ncbi:MAG: ATP-binding cassette domain-containing protein [Amaricoccus sp.]
MSEHLSERPTDAILSCEGLGKSFGAVRALSDIAFWARRGEVTALIGDNGAGKSTLVRCLVGVHQPDAGSILFDGAPHPSRTPTRRARPASRPSTRTCR